MLQNRIKSEYPHLTKADLMKKCMQLFKEQFTNSFAKDDSSTGSFKDNEECVLAGEG